MIDPLNEETEDEQCSDPDCAFCNGTAEINAAASFTMQVVGRKRTNSHESSEIAGGGTIASLDFASDLELVKALIDGFEQSGYELDVIESITINLQRE
jgi:hypothetical protein